MSVSAGSIATSPLASWQKMLQSGGTSSSEAQSFDPLAELMKAAGGGDKPSKASKGAPSAPFGQDMMAQLIALQQQASASGNTGASDPANAKLFAKLDTDRNSMVSKAEFEAAASTKGVSAAITNAVFAKIDTDGDGAISRNELAVAEKAGDPEGAHHAGGPGGPGGDESDKGAKTTTTVNADHSVTTTITYADGSTNSTTSLPPATANGGSADDADNAEQKSKNAGNAGVDLFRQLAELQKHVMSAAVTTLSAVI